MQTNNIGFNIGQRVKSARLQAKLTQEQLAEKVGVSWSTISCLERGQHMVSIERLFEISSALNIGIETLLCDYINIDNFYGDDISQEILKTLPLLSYEQKKYLVEKIRLILDIFSSK